MQMSADVMDTGTARRTVLRALDRNPHDSFTSVRLSQTLGMPLAQVLHALEGLTRAGLVLTIDGEYVSALQLD